MSGTQSLERAILLLRVVGYHSRSGARLTDVTTASGLSQPTVHRMLAALQAQGLVTQDPRSRRYFLGDVLAELGMNAAIRSTFRDLHRSAIARLAAETEETAFLSKLSGLDVVCLDRRSGPNPSKAFVLDVGVRRPLGVGASGYALLAAMPPDERVRILTQNAAAISLFEHYDLHRAMADAEVYARQGFALREHPETDMRSIAVAFRSEGRGALACFSVSAFSAQMPDERIPEVVALLTRETKRAAIPFDQYIS